jgi:RNA polymerase sigma-70 factor, ECF subfamily
MKARSPSARAHVAETLSASMAAAQRGDAAAYRRVLDESRGILELYLGRILTRMGKGSGSAVDDLAQEVLLAVHEKRHSYDPAQPFLPWLFAIARYKAIDFGRREKVRSVEVHGIDETLFADPVSSDPGVARDVKLLLAELPERQRRALELVKLEGKSVAEAAASEKVSEGALKVTVHRALKALRRKGSSR